MARLMHNDFLETGNLAKEGRAMNAKQGPWASSTMAGVIRSVIALFSALTFPSRPVPLPASAARPPFLVKGGRRLSRPPTGWLAPLLLLAALAPVPVWAGQTALPAGVPNIFDPEVRERFEPVAVINLRGNPDLPMLLVVSKTGEQPQAMALGLDARNGKDTWSLKSDPIILIVLFADPSTILAAHVDAGFSEEGKPSGTYMAVDDPSALNLPEIFKAMTAIPPRTYM